MYLGTSRLVGMMFCFVLFLIKRRPFVEKQSLIPRYKEASSGSGSSSGNRA